MRPLQTAPPSTKSRISSEGEGGACSRSAVGRYTKNVRDLIRQQQETDRGIEMWVRALGERPCRAVPGSS